jgi:arylsulfatase A-like enzyme
VSVALAAAATAVFLSFVPRFELLGWRQALAANARDTLLLLACLCIHGALAHRLQPHRAAIALLFAGAYTLLALVMTANYVMLAAAGTFFDLALLGHLRPGNIGTAWPATMPMLPDASTVLVAGSFVTFLLALAGARSGRLSLRLILILSAFLAAVSFTASQLVPPAPLTRPFAINPLLHLVSRALFPSTTLAALRGQHPQAHLVGDADWAAQPARPGTGCCGTPNILLLTVDSVSAAQWSREAVLAAPDIYPNLAALYRRGTYFSNFYANVPLSALSQQAMMNALHPSELFSMRVNGGFPTLSGELAGRGYASAHFMTGRLSFLQVDRFLEGRGFQTIKDSTGLRCAPEEAKQEAYYGHGGDDCTARASVQWLQGRGGKPFFLWTWLGNPHFPYFTGKGPDPATDTSKDAHGLALAATDAAIGRITGYLRATGLETTTLVALVGDHGQAFGEHGLWRHATSVHEEQVHVPLLLAGPGIAAGGTDPVLGSMVDLAPTLLDRAGYSVPAGWQGRSLLDANRPKRVYFRSIYGGRTAGYREGDRKVILSEFGPPEFYDLRRDPAERRPLPLSAEQQKAAEARIAAYIRYNRGVWWPQRR